MLSCRQEQETTSEYTVEQTLSSECLNEFKTNLGHVIRDTIGEGPQNERVDITDNKGRPLVVAGRPSEADVFTFIKYLYDDKGEITGFLCFPFNEAEQYNYDATEGTEAFYQQFDENLFGEEPLYEKKVLFDLVFTKGNDEPYLERFYFKRDSVGRIIKVYDPILHKSIIADEDWHIEYNIEENEDFWANDFEGGYVWLTFTFKPNPGKEKDPEDVVILKKKYYGYVDFKDMITVLYPFIDDERYEELMRLYEEGLEELMKRYEE